MTADSTQWQNLLKNLGAWHGSFTQLSARGQEEANTPTIVSLEGLNDHKTIRQTIQRFSASDGEPTQVQSFEYSSLNRSILVFQDGAFSQGSIQWAPFTEFGAEFGFIHGDRRLRLIEIFDNSAQLSSLTLIRERLTASQMPDRPPLKVEMLLGDWQGEAVTLYPDWRSERYATRLTITQQGDRLHQRLVAPQMDFASTAVIEGDRLLFDQGRYPVQVLLLPDGASSNTPLSIPREQPFFLEAGWLITPTLRQRLIRRYDDRGGWISLTLVTEQKT